MSKPAIMEGHVEQRPAGLAGAPSASRERLISGLVVLAIFLCSRSLMALLHLAWNTDEYTHVLLVIPVSLALLLSERKHSAAAVFAPSALAAIIGLLGLVAVLVPSGLSADYTLALHVAGFVVLCIAAVIGVYGVRTFRVLSFPLLFLFLIVPLPADLLEKAVVFLQTWSTEATFLLFKIANVPVIKHGFVLSLPSINIEVAKQCSGIRSSIILSVTCLVLAHLFLRCGWSKLVFVLCVVPMAIAKNAIRIFTLSLLGIYVNPDFLEGRLHHQGGIVFFSLALASLFVLIRVLQKLEDTKGRPAPAAL